MLRRLAILSLVLVVIFAAVGLQISTLSAAPAEQNIAGAPNANLFVFDRDGEPRIRQLTFLLDQELAPSVMRDGRVIFSAEKRARDFHQLATRRQNLDGGDYHPLFAQRPSIGFASASEVIELPNKNLAFVAANFDAVDGGGWSGSRILPRPRDGRARRLRSGPDGRRPGSDNSRDGFR